MAHKVDLLAPGDGTTFLLDGTYLSNLVKDEPPEGQPAELYLFIERYVRGKLYRRFVHTIAAETEEQAISRLREFASRSDVALIEETTRKPIQKDWLSPETLATSKQEVSG